MRARTNSPACVVEPIPWHDPVAAFAPLADEPMAVLLDSAMAGPQGRYSYIACAPYRIIRASPAPWATTIDSVSTPTDPFGALAAAMARSRQPSKNLPVPFGGGAIGFFAYELGGTIEALPKPHTPLLPADMVVGLYDTVAAFDHAKEQAWVISHATDRTEATAQAASFIERLGKTLPPVAPVPRTTWAAMCARADYEVKVAEAIDLIRAGDIFQVNFTQRFSAPVPPGLDWFGLYCRLRDLAPGPFAAFLNAGDGLRILSASPERFLSLDKAGRVESRPIKGTRPRGHDATSDAALAQALVASAKDRAENLMIVDLLRNDLGRVCRPGSITVPMLHGLETFPAVHHLVSAINGRLRPGATAVDLLRACFPGGSVTGAPKKIHAMEIIHGLEGAARGPYCGAIAWLGFDGAMDSSIVIRSLISDGHVIYAQAGGGVVADSDPALEYEESLVKVAPLLRALGDVPWGP